MRPLALAAAALATLVLLACGGSDPAPATPAATPATAATEAAAASVPDEAAVSTTPKIYFIHTEW